MDKKPYLDGVFIWAPDFNTLLSRLNKTFEHMGGIGLRLNLSKCNTGQREVKFIGNIVSREGYRPDPKNIEAIEKMKAPTTVKETRRFLGMCSFYS